MFKRKLDDEKSVYRFKACLVAKRFFQKRGVDCSGTIILAALLKAFLLAVAQVLSENWYISHVTTSTANLSGHNARELCLSWHDVVYKFWMNV